MSPLFRRRRDDDDIDAAVEEAAATGAAETGDSETGDRETGDEPAAEAARPRGPWDVADVPAEGPERVDLGSLQVPLVYDDVELRVDLDPEQQVVGVTLADEARRTVLQVNAFAAPRSEGIWAEVREEIAAELRSTSGSAETVVGRFGPELRAVVPTADAPGGGGQPARFLGVDGPRWFLRGLVSGAGAEDREAAARVEEIFAGLVVVRGSEAMVARDLLPLRLPREAMAALQAQQGADAAAEQEGAGALDPFVRGPEITETR